MKTKLKVIIAAIVAAVVVVAGGITGTVISVHANKPEVASMNAVNRAAEDFFDRHEIMHFRNLFKNGSLEAEVNSMKQSDGTEILPLTINAKLYFNLQGLYIEHFTLKNETEEETLSGMVSQDKFYIEGESLGGAFGILKSNCQAQLEGLDLEHDMPEYKLMKAVFDMYTNAITYADTVEEVEDALREMAEKFDDLVIDMIPLTVEKTKVLVHGVIEKARKLSFNFKAKSSLELIIKFFEYLKEDSSPLMKLLDNHPEVMNIVVTALELSGKSLEEGKTIKSILQDSLAEVISDLHSSIGDIDEEVEALDIFVNLYTKPSKAVLMRADFILHDPEVADDFEVKFNIGADGMAKTDKLSLTWADPDDTSLVYTVNYEVLEKGKNKFKCRISMDAANFFEFEIDKKAGTWNLRVGQWGEDLAEDSSFIVKGTYEGVKNGSKFVAKYFRWAAAEEDEHLDLDFVITINENEKKLPKGVEDKDIKPMFETEEKFAELMENLGKTFDKFFGEPEPEPEP